MPVFISHSHRDQKVYQMVSNALKERGINAWDVKSLQVGQNVAEQLRQGIDSCEACIFLASKNSLGSGWCTAEMGAFWGAGKRVLIFAANPTMDKNTIPDQFRSELWTSDLDQLFQSLEALMFPGGSLGSPSAGKGAVAVISADSRDLEKNDAIREVIEGARSPLAGSIKFVNSFRQLDQDSLTNWHGLFLSMPYSTYFSGTLIERIVGWVREGGRLAICGFELGEWHHGSNINRLAGHFGMNFRSDVIVRPDGPVKGKQFDWMQSFKSFSAPVHPILKGVSDLHIRNCCSLYLEPGCRPLVGVRPNRIIELEPESAKYSPVIPFSSEGPLFKLAAGEQKFLPPYRDANRAVMAEAPRGLCGNGNVIAIGSWDFRGAEFANDIFITKLFSWLCGATAP
jgi:hypothetical protein